MKHFTVEKIVLSIMLFCLVSFGLIGCGANISMPSDNYSNTPYVEETDETNDGSANSQPDNVGDTEISNNDSAEDNENDNQEDQNEIADENAPDADDQTVADNEEPPVADDEVIADDIPADEDLDQDESQGDVEDPPPQEDEQPLFDCLHLKLVATKSYKPSKSLDAEETPERVIQFAIPSKIPVTKGNAGNYSSKFYFIDPTDDEEVTCTYKGGANKSHPKDSVQIEKGLYYEFKECDNDMIDGETALSNYFRLEIVNGDSKAGETEISLTIDELPGECAE